MENFNPVRAVCEKIADVAHAIADYEDSIVELQNHSEKGLADSFLDVQAGMVEQLQKLTISLTGIIFPEKLELEEGELKSVNQDESEGGSVFTAGELDHKKQPPFEINFPEDTIKNE